MTTCKMYMGFCSAIALCGLLLVRQFAAVNESPDSGTARPSVDNPTIDEACCTSLCCATRPPTYECVCIYSSIQACVL